MNEQIGKALRSLTWLPTYGWQQLTRRGSGKRGRHLMIAVADHFEPSFVPEAPHTFAPLAEQKRRLSEWCREYRRTFDRARDADGFPLQHTYFYPAEQYEPGLMQQLADFCRDGWGEVEIHLHHGIAAPDTAGNTRRTLSEFRDRLVGHGCLSRWDGAGSPCYAFVHGNWALANSAGGRYCGVDDEMQILAETGCYADLTLPSAPSKAQTARINSIYECALPLNQRAPHRRGIDLRRGRAPQKFPLIVQGPLALELGGARGGRFARIENGELTTARPGSLSRLPLWRNAAIAVRGCPEWIFIKLHCHGMDPRDREAMIGRLGREFSSTLIDEHRTGAQVHFVSAREMVNILLAACDGREGNPGHYRDYRLRRITAAVQSEDRTALSGLARV